jgi:hypothetical protein
VQLEGPCRPVHQLGLGMKSNIEIKTSICYMSLSSCPTTFTCFSPTDPLERALQLIKGGFSYRAKKELGFASEIWEKSFHDWRVRDWEEYFLPTGPSLRCLERPLC